MHCARCYGWMEREHSGRWLVCSVCGAVRSIAFILTAQPVALPVRPVVLKATQLAA